MTWLSAELCARCGHAITLVPLIGWTHVNPLDSADHRACCTTKSQTGAEQ